MRARVVTCLNEIAGPVEDDPGGASVVVFSHGGAIRVAAAHAAGIPSPGHVGLAAPSNCSVTELELTATRTALMSYNLPLWD